MEILEKIINSIEQAKGDVLRRVVENIEGRPAELSDGKNIVLANYSGFQPANRQMVIYKDSHIGYIDVDLAERRVIFEPN